MSGTVIVIGAGVVGTLTAFWLAERGFRVQVLEQRPGSALGTSYGNAGIVALGHAEAWGSPNTPRHLMNAVLGRNPALKISKPVDPSLWRWGSGFMRESTAARYKFNSNQLLRLCEYSIEQLRTVGDGEAIEHHRSDIGALYLFRDPDLFRARVNSIASDPDATRLLKVKTREQILAMDPALASMGESLAGGVFSRRDISGDCRMFTQTLSDRLIASGRCEFRFGTTVRSFVPSDAGTVSVDTDQGLLAADHVVLTAGFASTALMAPLGIYLPIYPVKGYSMTFPILNGNRVPRYPGIDEDHLVSYARYGDRLRVTSVAEFAGDDDSLVTSRLKTVADFAYAMCGDALDYENVERWAGLRPATPASSPYLGRVAAFSNLWVNAGHGQLGWSMSAGSGRLIADAIAGEALELSGVSSTADWLVPLG